MKAKVLRKKRSAGLVNLSTKKFSREQLDEIALAAQYSLHQRFFLFLFFFSFY